MLYTIKRYGEDKIVAMVSVNKKKDVYVLDTTRQIGAITRKEAAKVIYDAWVAGLKIERNR